MNRAPFRSHPAIICLFMRMLLKRYLVLLAAWFPFYALWVLLELIYGRLALWNALVGGAISMGSATLLGAAVWHVTKRWPWPLRLSVGFYLLHVAFATVYSCLWILGTYWLESVHRGTSMMYDLRHSPTLPWQSLIGLWLYGIIRRDFVCHAK